MGEKVEQEKDRLLERVRMPCLRSLLPFSWLPLVHSVRNWQWLPGCVKRCAVICMRMLL